MYKDHMKLMQFTCSQGCKVREATHWITGHVAGGVLAPTDIDIKTGKIVLQSSLNDKQPPPGRLDPAAFLTCDVLPPLTDVDIVAFHIEQIAHKRSCWAKRYRLHTVAEFPAAVWVL